MNTETQTQQEPAISIKSALSFEILADDISLSNEEGTSWYSYPIPDDDNPADAQRVLLADEYNDVGEIIATHKIWIEIEYDENGTQPA